MPAPLGLASGAVRLATADPSWPALFAAERGRLLAAAGDLPLVIEHVGSTAVPGLPAKPILDLMGGRPAGSDLAPYVAALEAAGYRHRGEYGIPGRHYFVRDDAERRRTHHLHVVEHEGVFWREHLAFRDALRADPALRDAYAALKRDLAARLPRDRAAYTDGKTAFVRRAVATTLAPAPGGR